MAATRPGRLLVLAALILALPGCKLFRHHRDTSCREPSFAQDQGNLPPLKIPTGLNAPDTREGVHVPALTEPERPRAKSEPCLSQPPSYVTTEVPVQPAVRAEPQQPAGGVVGPPATSP